MASRFRSVLIWAFLAGILVFIPVFNSYAAVLPSTNSIISEVPLRVSGTIDSPGGDGTLTPQEDSTTITHQGLNYTLSENNGTTIYTFEGENYTLQSSFGVHRITGYTTEGNTDVLTNSGSLPKESHTIAASSSLPIGTVVLLKSVSGPNADLYEGIYVVEDRGGARIEQEDFLDIFFDTYAEAIAVTNSGWNDMEVFILKPVFQATQ